MTATTGNLPADLLTRLATDVRDRTADPAMIAAALAQTATAIAAVTEALSDALVGDTTMPASRLASSATDDAALLAARLRAVSESAA
ncbi:hypothetical protein [Nocardia carnea]|uniref:hypothetical protein n=1 Tax=Nocardia carnea TaxID=37328 RepID=UPI00245887D0|nr:hypothetical protein [Nocardia carnea]